jgi:hypothetical protein
MAKFELNSSGMREILTGHGCLNLVGSIADRVAASTAAGAGMSGGEPVQADVLGPEVNRQGNRARAAVIVRHPSPAGRELGIRALISSL